MYDVHIIHFPIMSIHLPRKVFGPQRTPWVDSLDRFPGSDIGARADELPEQVGGELRTGFAPDRFVAPPFTLGFPNIAQYFSVMVRVLPASSVSGSYPCTLQRFLLCLFFLTHRLFFRPFCVAVTPIHEAGCVLLWISKSTKSSSRR